MSKASTQHIVFAGRGGRISRAINFAPRGQPRLADADADPLSHEDRSFIEWIFNQAGLSSRWYRSETLRRRLPAVLRALRVASNAEAKATIAADAQQLPEAISAFLIGVSSFFRDRSVFAALDRHVLSDLCRDGKGVRAWSAGCSDGAELYSLAILLAERNRLHGSELLGTDCRSDAIEASLAGQYDALASANVTHDLRAKYFVFSGAAWTIRGWLRTVPRWVRSNILEQGQEGAWDMIFCRNLAIYLQPEATALLWERLGAALRPGGFLVVGRADHPIYPGLRSIGNCIFQRSMH